MYKNVSKYAIKIVKKFIIFFFLEVYYRIRYIRIIGILSLTDTVVTRQDVKVIKIIYKKD